MSDIEFENEFEATDEAAAAANPANEVVEPGATNAEVVEVVEEIRGEKAPAEGPSEDDFFTENAAVEVPAVDPSKIVTIQTTSASDKLVQVNGPMAVIDLIHLSGLQFAGDFEVFLNGAKIELTTLVPGGSTIVIAGKVKGG